MLVRKPQLDLEGAPIVWSRIPEFAQIWNGASAVIPYVEHYLVNVVHEIMTNHCAGNEKLRSELEMFIDQERTHANYHVQFNKRLYDAGYTDLKQHIETVKAEYRALRETHSLAYCIAYCAGFENAATFSSQFFLEECSDLLEGSDPRGSDILIWHVAEEFEHRSVCHDAFMHVSGNYFTRMAALFHSFWHINHNFTKAAMLILERDRQSMSEAERAESERRRRALVKRQHAYVLPRVLQLLNPTFDPAKFELPPRTAQALEYYRDVQPTQDRFGYSVLQV